MTGTGTSADPYIIDNFDDFVSKIAETGVYITLDPDAANKVMDVNDSSYSGGFTASLTFACAQITGNGWEIRNLYCMRAVDLLTTASGIGCVSISDVKLQNIAANIGASSLIRSGSNSYFHFTRCTFAGVYNHGDSTGMMTDAASSANAYWNLFTDCAFNMQIVGTGVCVKLLFRSKFDCCNYQVSGTIKNGTSYNFAFFSTCIVTNTALLGALTLDRTNDTGYYRYYIFDSSCTTNLSYCAVAFTNAYTSATSQNAVITAAAPSSACFIDSAICGDAITVTAATNFYALTTTQAKDADYLSDTIGFPCSEVSA